MTDTPTKIAATVTEIATKAFVVPVRNKAEAALLDAHAAAAMCGIARTLWLALHNSGRIPLPVRLGRRVLWRKAELSAWIEAGCPPQSAWNAESRARQGYVAQEGGRP